MRLNKEDIEVLYKYYRQYPLHKAIQKFSDERHLSENLTETCLNEILQSITREIELSETAANASGIKRLFYTILLKLKR